MECYIQWRTHHILFIFYNDEEQWKPDGDRFLIETLQRTTGIVLL